MREKGKPEENSFIGLWSSYRNYVSLVSHLVNIKR
jgi:hypothetical protein